MATDYERTIRVHAPADALYDAVTTPDGVTAWWVPAQGSGDAGGELRLTMSAPDAVVVHVDDATRPASVRWTVTACPVEPDWVDTHPTFTIVPIDPDACELTFRHVGLTDELECIEMCTNGWNHYLGSLRDYAETGVGSPRGSAADLARRASA